MSGNMYKNRVTSSLHVAPPATIYIPHNYTLHPQLYQIQRNPPTLLGDETMKVSFKILFLDSNPRAPDKKEFLSDRLVESSLFLARSNVLYGPCL